MNEHQRIAHYLAPLTAHEEGAFGLKNDAACLHVPNNMRLVITSDGVTAGIHLPADASAEQLARKLIRRNISDLAAMGADPWRYSLNLQLTGNESSAWWEQLSATLRSEQTRYNMVLIGGDCAAGVSNVHMSISCYGLSTGSLGRDGAQNGDHLYVTGTIGEAALYLHATQQAFATSYYAPEPPIMFAQQLHSIATSCIDISDGLLVDAEHIAAASNCAITIMQEAIPLSKTARILVQQNPQLWQHVVSGGDDYQLLFTATASNHQTVMNLANTHHISVSHIGHIVSGKGVRILDAHKHVVPFLHTGYRHY